MHDYRIAAARLGSHHDDVRLRRVWKDVLDGQGKASYACSAGVSGGLDGLTRRHRIQLETRMLAGIDVLERLPRPGKVNQRGAVVQDDGALDLARWPRNSITCALRHGMRAGAQSGRDQSRCPDQVSAIDSTTIHGPPLP